MGAVIDWLTRSLPTDVPVELFVAWAVWLLGGLLLMLWFTRRSGASRVPPVRPASAVAAKKSSGTHAVARPASSGTHAAARPSSGSHAPARTAGRQAAAPPAPSAAAAPVTYSAPNSNGPIPDAYSELSLLLDSVEEQSRSNP